MTHSCSATSQPNRSSQHVYRARCRRSPGLGFDQDLEPAVNYVFEVEGHGLPITHFRDARILHHLGIDAVAMRTRLVDDPGEYHRLARLCLGQARERNSERDLEIVAGTLSVFERAMVAPDWSCLFGHATVGLQILLGGGQDKSIDVPHVNPPSQL